MQIYIAAPEIRFCMRMDLLKTNLPAMSNGPSNSMPDSSLDLYGQIRLLVGYLGEKAQENWWPTAFFDPSSKLFLDPVVPRTVRLAQYNGVREAGRRLHDSHVAVGNVCHLFRLPEEVEQDLHQRMLVLPGNWFDDLASKETAMDALAALAGEASEIEEGPQSLGKFAQMYRPSGAKTLARHYLTAFERGIRSYPYFTR